MKALQMPRFVVGALVFTALTAHPGYSQAALQTALKTAWDSAQSVFPPVASTRWDSTKAEWTGRVVVGEYSTGVFCVYCQAHDAAFNALLQRYPATAFLSLAYHYAPNLPFGDPADSTLEHLHRWYGVDKMSGILDRPLSTGDDDWIDGRSINDDANVGLFLGGGSLTTMAQKDYTGMVQAIDAELRRPPEAFFHVQTHREGGQIQVRVTVDSLTGAHPQTYLRLLLVEDTVTLQHPLYWYIHQAHRLGAQGWAFRREHHMVVRAVAHGGNLPMGLPLAGPGVVQYTFDVAAIQRRLEGYHHTGLSALRPYEPHDLADPANVTMMRNILQMFPDSADWHIDPRRLHVVAFVQDAHTGEVLQAAMVGVSD